MRTYKRNFKNPEQARINMVNGAKNSLEKRQKALKGRVFTDEWKEKIRLGRAKFKEKHGYFYSPEAIERQRLSHLGKKLSAETKLKLSLGQKGEKGSNWRGGKTKQSKILRSSAQYRTWRKAVFERDDYTCQHCGQRGGKLNSDHIKPVCLSPELIFEIDNGRTLCYDCHKKTDTWGYNSVTKHRKKRGTFINP